VVGNNIDITERVQTKEALREREEKLRLALDASGAGSWMRDIRTGQIDWDERFRKLYGFTAEEPASLEAWLSRIHEEDRQQVWNSSSRSVTGRRMTPLTARSASCDPTGPCRGSRVWVKPIVMPMDN
jgi:PAS domain S-box-containing protein